MSSSSAIKPAPENLPGRPIYVITETGIPVIIFAWLIAYTISGVGKLYKNIKSFEFWFRKVVAVIFIGIGIYYIIAIWV